MAKSKTAPSVLFIAHNHPKFFPGGAEVFAYRLFQQLRDEGRRVFFLAATGRINGMPHSGTPFQAAGGAENEFLFWGEEFDYFLQSQRQPVVLYNDFAELLRQISPDIVHFHHTLRIGVEALAVVRHTLPKARIAYTLHDFIPLCHRDGQMVKTGSEALCEKAAPADCNKCFPVFSPVQFAARDHFIRTHFNLVDRFISPSEFLATRYRDWGVEKPRITVIRNGIAAGKPASSRKLTGKQPHNRFAYFGQITPYKGVLLLMEAAKLLQKKKGIKIHIDIYGHVDMQAPEFKKRFHAALKNCGDAVHFHGAYQQKDIPRLMEKTDWVVTPSTWWENAPLVIDEALAHRRPVICAGLGGMAEKIKDGVNGLHFAHGDARDLAATMERAASEPKLWERLRRNISPPFSIADCAEAHEKLYAAL